MGVTPPELVTGFHTFDPRVFGLPFFLSIAQLVEADDMLERFRRGDVSHDLAARFIAGSAKSSFRDVEIVPVVGVNGVYYDTSPRSLHSYLWKWLLWRCGRLPRQLCRYCGNSFEVPPGPGQPPRYCPEHRASRYRQSVRGGRVPAMQIPNALDSSDDQEE